MAKPKIRHLALFARDPKKLADFYTSVFDMEVAHAGKNAYFLTDGYLMLAILPHRLEGEAAVGLNHFGFNLENRDEVVKKLQQWNLEVPKARPGDRPYAEFRAVDPEGNWFDLSEEGLKDDEGIEKRQKALETVGGR
ncbi:MAG TPA: VOC family protein [Stellaceae bacterium]|nr:VOC family protein [Stellaceae bacterium]